MCLNTYFRHWQSHEIPFLSLGGKRSH